MTYIPEVPLWCWVLQGEDQLFFSQPSLAWLEGTVLSLADRCACVARCQHQTQFLMDDQPCDLETMEGITPPIQCGAIAHEDALGRLLCTVHRGAYWQCHHCAAPLSHGEGGFCSQACREDSDALDSED